MPERSDELSAFDRWRDQVFKQRIRIARSIYRRPLFAEACYLDPETLA